MLLPRKQCVAILSGPNSLGDKVVTGYGIVTKEARTYRRDQSNPNLSKKNNHKR